MDMMQALPILILALVMAAAMGPSLTNAIIAISVPIVPRAARVVRANVLAIREFAYVEAARAVGGRGTCGWPSGTSCPTRWGRSSCC